MQHYFYGFIVIASVICFLDWRKGLYLCLVIDVIRDPIRKLSEGQPILVTISGVLPWVGVFFGMLMSEGNAMNGLWKKYPMMRVALTCIFVALVPAGLISTIMFERGLLLAIVGSGSYVAPLFGIALGFVLARSETSVYSLLRFYSLLNSATLVSVLFEKWHMAVPALGGIQTEWVRYRQGYTVDLISGFYRSPDIMGLHAAHVLLFSALLALRARGLSKIGYFGLMFWATVGLFLCGRRKMVGMPLVFAAAFMLLARWRGIGRIGGQVVFLSSVAVVAGALFLSQQGDEQGDEYTDYAVTMFTEGHERANDNVLGGTITTLQQVGVLGGGLGTATQGRYYLGVKTSRATRGWQEDGVSRLFMELGVPGVLLMIIALIQVLLAIRYAIIIIPSRHSVQRMQIGLAAAVAADAMSYVFSHQQYSGDPVSALLVTVMMGAILGAPQIFANDMARLRQLREARLRSSNRQQSAGTVEPQPGLGTI